MSNQKNKCTVCDNLKTEKAVTCIECYKKGLGLPNKSSASLKNDPELLNILKQKINEFQIVNKKNFKK